MYWACTRKYFRSCRYNTGQVQKSSFSSNLCSRWEAWIKHIRYKKVNMEGNGSERCMHLALIIYSGIKKVKSLSRVRRFVTLWTVAYQAPPSMGFSLHEILQARILEWVAISFSNACMHGKSLQSCPTLHYPIDGSPPGSSVHRIL